MAAFRFTTAGESHGPGLVAIVEGLPAGLELDRERIDREMARRQLGHGRGGRMKIETRRGRGPLRDPPRPHARQPDRAAGRQPRLRQLGGADEPVAGRRRGRGVAPAAARPRRPRRRAEVRPPRRPQRARARQRARDRRAGRRRRDRQGVPARARRRASSATCCGSPRSSAARARPTSTPRTSPASTSRRSAASTPRPRRGWSPRSTGCGRPTRASAASSRSAPSAWFPGSARTSPGTSASTAASPHAVVSIQAVKGVSVGEAWEVAGAPGLGVPRRDLLVGGARLSPRDQPRRRGRGRDVERRAADRPRALKPISTLTKPLRSVDTETKEPAQAMRERTDSTVVPAAGRRRRGDGRAGACPLLSREVRRRPHR